MVSMSQFIEMFGGLCQDTSWSDVVTITNGKAYPEEYQEEGAYPICGSGGIMCYGEKKLCNGNTTILGRKGNINNPIFMESGYWIVDTAFSIDVDKAKLHPKFFYYWCCQYDFTMLNKQGVLPSLTRKDLEKVKMAIPQMRDQLKFVSIAEQADKSKFGDFKSQFIEMFGNLPIDGTIADVVERNIKSVKKNFSPEDIIEYIDISSVDSSSHTIVETSQHVVSHAPSRAQQCVESGDILVSTVRPINRNIAVVKSELSNLVASTGFCVLRPKDGFREYILSIVQSDPYTEQMCDKASGGLYPAVNNGDVLSFGIHIPDESQLKKVTYIYRQADKSISVIHR